MYYFNLYKFCKFLYLSLFPHPVFVTHLRTHEMYVYTYACKHACMYYLLHTRKMTFLQFSYIPHKEILEHHLMLNSTFLVITFVINNSIILCYTLSVIITSLSNPDIQNNAARVIWKFKQTQIQSHGNNTIYIMCKPICISL